MILGIANTANDFNPRPHVGSDGGYFTQKMGMYDFNPRPHVGSDPPIQGKCPHLKISIHAPM